MNEKTRVATHQGNLKIGEIDIQCYVLEDGTRLLSGRGMQRALQLDQMSGHRLKRLTNQISIKPFISNDLELVLDNPIKFCRPGHSTPNTSGYDASVLTKLCDAILEARDKSDKLTPKQFMIAKQCEMLTRAFATVGIIALVDEATGYQEIRDRIALQEILDKYLKDEYSKWTKQFPDDYYKELFRLRNISYPPVPGKNVKPGYVGHWTNDIVYSRLAPELLDRLKKLVPRNEKGNRPRKFHMHLTEDIGIPELQEHLSNVIFLMKGCTTWDDFKRRLERAKPKYGYRQEKLDGFED